MLGRRFLLLVAVLMGLTALAASVAPRDPALQDPESGRRTATPTPSPQSAEPAAPRAATDVTTVVRTISADAERQQRVVVTEGDLVELTVEGSELDSVEVLGLIEPLDRNSPARFNILADRVDDYPIKLLEAEREIGTLEVRES
jgi:hypothetical protein